MSSFSVAQLANFATRALIYEVSVNPKPGLVDPVSSGPHPDMTVFTFIDSSLSLQPYLQLCAQLGDSWTAELPGLFKELRSAGVKAEQAMFSATGGINTHKGAIFSLGILTAATAYQQRHPELMVPQVVKTMLAGLSDSDFSDVAAKPATALTAGERLYLDHGITGVRGEAEAGFPSVFKVGLPTLQRAQGTLNERLLDSLLSILSQFTDTNLIHRAGTLSILPVAQRQALAILRIGGTHTTTGKMLLRKMNTDFMQQNLSLGGSADMLILTIFMAFVEESI
ncbi:2-(5-triphosphoribosyl)-3-dephosphocoenzyme-a synthase [Lacticaseibacillus pantheris DSM 15945 = JCM 12539 = NBRC 106106]|uniref:Probable 2-(5''-triphosphoribosyl)-3'-dephosphocoenzyme-A synthase n=1 Tax=Lacticaseibacillus pantheris DSM 15945 = JCM 12539 = NBRC 106106 TaxID=1423783 RepID=A0A0R1U637_9LACO|nr:triphosphoribosyl-dephospho-CoA synthase [Lacticaseibacillus pantheris]KRL88212.1 2-(5-triphosphoribosyl)-3-dephosphocoenzyme-a synthase [Lacticaseibacillus pantheris DSM 15945 = JCM 12539 = NBRC 106106]